LYSATQRVYIPFKYSLIEAGKWVDQKVGET